MAPAASDIQHAALWLIGPDMPGLLNLGASFVAKHGGNINKDIADKFGEKAMVFMSITAKPADIARMADATASLKEASGCGVVFQAMKEPTVPPGYLAELYGFDIITDDAVGLVAELTSLVAKFGMMLVGHTGEQRVLPGPRRQVKAGQKFIVMMPFELDHGAFGLQLSQVVKKFNGSIVTSLRTVPGLLWWW